MDNIFYYWMLVRILESIMRSTIENMPSELNIPSKISEYIIEYFFRNIFLCIIEYPIKASMENMQQDLPSEMPYDIRILDILSLTPYTCTDETIPNESGAASSMENYSVINIMGGGTRGVCEVAF